MSAGPGASPTAGHWGKLALLAAFVAVIAAFFALGGQNYLSLESVKANRDALLGFAQEHFIAALAIAFLVYVGATLPLLLVLLSAGVSTTDALNAQDVAEPIVATLIGAMALLLCVPLTTALAAVLVSHVPADALPDAHAGHHH